MKTIFRKAMTVLGSAALVGASVGAAAAAAYPDPFTGSTAVVTGSNNNALDNAAAAQIKAVLDAANAGSVVSSLSGGVEITEDEITLGGSIVSGEISAVMDEGDDLPLLDEELTWDDGTGSEEYSVHEEIRIGTMKVYTTLDDELLEGYALSNEQGLSYRYVFEEALNTSLVGDDDADSLHLTILGNSYEITGMTNSSITVVTSEEVSMSKDDSVIVDGKVFTLNAIGPTFAKVNGQIVSTSSIKIDGLRVQIKENSIFYDENDVAGSSLTLQIGNEISKTYSDGDEYIGEDEDDPLWVWEISSLSEDNGYVGVSYYPDIDSANDEIAGDTIKYVGEGYVMPQDFAQVTLDSVTDAGYQDISVYFADNVDLFLASDSSGANVEGADVLVIEAEEGDAFTTNSLETGKIYLHYNATDGFVNVYYDDSEEEAYDPIRMRFSEALVNTTTNTEVATFEYGETNLDVDFQLVTAAGTSEGANVAYLTITNDDDSDNVVLNVTIGGNQVNVSDSASTGKFDRFGATAETVDTGSILFDDVDVSGEDYSYTEHYGVMLSDGTTVEAEEEDDRVTISIPDEQVYAQVTVMVGGESSESGSEGGAMTYTDASAPTNMNMIVVGGSAVNSVAAELLNGAHSEGAFTTATGIAAGEALIQSFARGDYTAVLVAGYNAEDTSMAATYLNNEDVDVSVGKKWKVISETEAVAIEA